MIQVCNRFGPIGVDCIHQVAQTSNMITFGYPQLPWMLLSNRINVAWLNNDCGNTTLSPTSVVIYKPRRDFPTCRCETRFYRSHYHTVGELQPADTGRYEGIHQLIPQSSSSANEHQITSTMAPISELNGPWLTVLGTTHFPSGRKFK
jgi:hypothetical protein